MKSILFIHQSAELYGSDKTILMFISSLDKQKYKSIVILPFDGPLKREFEKNNIEVIIAPVLKLYRKMFTPKGILKFFKEYKEGLKTLNELHKKQCLKNWFCRHARREGDMKMELRHLFKKKERRY